MAVAPDASSPQGWVAATVTASGRSVVQIVAADGTEVASFTATKAFSSIVYSAAGITSGSSYTVQIDGTWSGRSPQATHPPAGWAAAAWAAAG